MHPTMRRIAFLALALAGTTRAGEANYQPFIVGERAAGMGGAVCATCHKNGKYGATLAGGIVGAPPATSGTL